MNVAVIKLLQNSYEKLQEEPVEGFTVVPSEDNFLEWAVYIEGPKDTPYEGGIFELALKFTKDYPMEPPSLRFVSEFFHPNVYENGNVCISILHSPGTDQHNELELASERWMPSQTVTSVILSVISLLNDPNFSSPANIDASVLWRNDFEKYKEVCADLVKKANEANSDVFIPHPESNPEERHMYLARQRERENEASNFSLYADSDDVDWGDFDDVDMDGSFSESFSGSLSEVSEDGLSHHDSVSNEGELTQEKETVLPVTTETDNRNQDQEQESITNVENHKEDADEQTDNSQEVTKQNGKIEETQNSKLDTILSKSLSGSKRKLPNITMTTQPKRQRVE